MDVLAKIKELIDRAERPAFELEEGKDASVEIARSGTFHAHVGGEVTLTPDDLRSIAKSFKGADEHLLKIGHVPIQTDTPHYGNVTSLAYDEAADRLRATIRPTPALIRRNRDEGFRRVSMECAKADAWEFQHLSFLGAKRPAIKGLVPVELGEGSVVYAFEEGEEFAFALTAETPKKDDPKPAPATVPEGGLTDPVKMEVKSKETEMEDKARIAELEAQLEESRKRNAQLAASDVKRFMEDPKIIERVPVGVRPKVTAVLTALAEMAGRGETIQFAEGGNKATVNVSLYELAKDTYAGFAPQLSEEEKKRTTDKGVDGKPEYLVGGEFAGVDEQSAVVDFEARKLMKAAEAGGEKIDYLEALRRAERQTTK